jgi:hypothetical protein
MQIFVKMVGSTNWVDFLTTKLAMENQEVSEAVDKLDSIDVMLTWAATLLEVSMVSYDEVFDEVKIENDGNFIIIHLKDGMIMFTGMAKM